MCLVRLTSFDSLLTKYLEFVTLTKIPDLKNLRALPFISRTESDKYVQFKAYFGSIGPKRNKGPTKSKKKPLCILCFCISRDILKCFLRHPIYLRMDIEKKLNKNISKYC